MRKEVKETRNSRIYNIHFFNITDLYEYLKSDPRRNTSIFSRPASLNPKEFYGVPLDQGY